MIVDSQSNYWQNDAIKRNDLIGIQVVLNIESDNSSTICDYCFIELTKKNVANFEARLQQHQLQNISINDPTVTTSDTMKMKSMCVQTKFEFRFLQRSIKFESKTFSARFHFEYKNMVCAVVETDKLNWSLTLTRQQFT